MNLMTILLQYLEKPTAEEGLAFLKDLQENVGMPESLIAHIVGCRSQTKVVCHGIYNTIDTETDVNIWTVQNFYPEIPKED